MLDKKPEDTSEYQKDYSDSAFWDKVKKYAIKIGSDVLYHIFILYYIMIDPNTPTQHKLLIAGALGYFILPIDLIPDAIIGFGFTDDIAALMKVFEIVKVNIKPEHEADAKAQIEKWISSSKK